MKLLRWILPTLMHVLSLSRLTSATGGNKASGPTSHTPQGTDGGPSFVFGLSLSAPPVQPDHQYNSFSLDLNLVLQVANHELKIPIMPLHLLGKKSWNVYNTSNIETVRRDEAQARALEEASEQRMQELDASRRLQILRGEEPTPLPIEDTPPSPSSKHARDYGHGSGRERKKRKRAGENDTDFEMRLAPSQNQNEERQLVLRRDGDAPLTDHTGHIDLFPQPKTSSSIQKNEEAERELAKKKKEYEDQYTMKFSNAAGFKNSIGADPWYKKTNSTSIDHIDDGAVSKDVWGNEDPRRKEREAQRIVSNDPLAMMKAGARQVRQVRDERMKWREEKDREMRALDEQERERRRNKKRRREYGSEDDIDFLDLDMPESSSKRHRDDDQDRERRHKRSKRHSEDVLENFSLDNRERSSSRRHHDDGERGHRREREEKGIERRHRRDEGRRHEDRDQDRRHRHKSRRHSYD